MHSASSGRGCKARELRRAIAAGRGVRGERGAVVNRRRLHVDRATVSLLAGVLRNRLVGRHLVGGGLDVVHVILDRDLTRQQGPHLVTGCESSGGYQS